MNQQPQMHELDQLEESVKKLRTAFEKYFSGVERVPPVKDRELVKKTLRRLTTAHNRNTAYRFRLQNLQASLITHGSYWDRILRQIEEGTYKRDVFRMKRSQAERALELPKEQTPELPRAPAAAAVPKKAAPVQHSASMQQLHAAYSKACSQTGNNRSVSVDALAKTVQKQMAVIKERYKCKRVEFKVAVKDGKAILKAVPKN